MGLKNLLDKIRLVILGIEAKEMRTPYKHLDMLIQRAEERMKIKPICPYCGAKMKFRFSHIVGKFPIRDDQTWKCPRCFHTAHFGIPMTRKEYEEEFKLRRGEYLLKPDYREDEKYRKDVLKRLKELGYLEF